MYLINIQPNYNLSQKRTITVLMFQNQRPPIMRKRLNFTAEEQNAMVKVSCYEPVVTTIAPIFYTKATGDDSQRIGWHTTGYYRYHLHSLHFSPQCCCLCGVFPSGPSISAFTRHWMLLIPKISTTPAQCKKTNNACISLDRESLHWSRHRLSAPATVMILATADGRGIFYNK